MLVIKNLSVSSGSQKILNDLSLVITPGTIHALMGPNGSGKSTLASVLMGHPDYVVTRGAIHFKQQDIVPLSPDKRAHLGIFLAFQHPCSIPGVSALVVLREAYHIKMGASVTLEAFNQAVNNACSIIGVDHRLLQRSLNDNFSGGEKKRLEMVQLLLLRPSLAILDEIDSGLDVDALKLVATALEYIRQEIPTMSIMLITHYQRILHHVQPDNVHIMHGGTIVASGGADLAQRIEREGYIHTKRAPQTQVSGNEIG